MDYLGRRAKQFRKNGRSQGEDMEKIISELKGAEEGDVTREMEDRQARRRGEIEER